MRPVFIFLLPLALFGCAVDVAPPSPELLQATNTQLVACLADAAHRLDDDHSALYGLASAVAAACAAQFQQSHYAEETGMSQSDKARFEERSQANETEVAKSVILSERAKRER